MRPLAHFGSDRTLLVLCFCPLKGERLDYTQQVDFLRAVHASSASKNVLSSCAIRQHCPLSYARAHARGPYLKVVL